jgi:hypothetical protein
MDGNAAGPRHPEIGALMPPPERMLRLFAYEHLQHADLRALSSDFPTSRTSWSTLSRAAPSARSRCTSSSRPKMPRCARSPSPKSSPFEAAKRRGFFTAKSAII